MPKRHPLHPFAAAALTLTLASAAFAAGPPARTIDLPLHAAFENGLGAHHVRMTPDQQTVELYNRVLYEDDGPGLGSDAQWLAAADRSPSQKLTGDTLFKKMLIIDRPEAIDAHFCINDGLLVTINGHPLSAAPTRGDYPDCPVAMLKKGANEIILQAPAGKTVWVKAALRKDILLNAPDRAKIPPRSFKSTDGGKTWQPYDGEFFVRLELVQYTPTGTLLSPIIDLAPAALSAGASPEQSPSASPADILQPPLHISSIALKTQQETPPGTSISYFVRTGSTPVYQADHWTDWQPAAQAKPSSQRYVEWKADLATADPTKTPVLKNVAVEAAVTADPPPPWAANLKIASAINPEFRYTSIPFQYEDPNSLGMKHLREKYQLDAVVAPGKTELEKLVLLRNWVATYWKYKPPEDHYPGWDADEILTLKYGFCVQYAITYMECATALGYQTRFVFGNNYQTGHEVTEVWSDDYGKWIFMDPNNNLFHIDPQTKVPMNLLEIRDLILKTYYDGAVATRENLPRDLKLSPDIATVYRQQFQPQTPVPVWREKNQNGGRGDQFYVPPYRWVILRYVDRNNYLSQPYPQPKTEGAGSWDYPNFWMWDDGRNLTQYRYRNLTARRSDLEWTINEVRFDAAYAPKPDTLALQMCTVTPYFETFLVNLNGKGWQKSGPTFDWPLHPGKNRVEMRSQNTSGIAGPISSMTINRP